MAQNIAQLPCPNCKSPIQADLQQVIDVGQDPLAKANLLSGNLNRTRCGVCGYEGQVATPLVYHDPEKELLLTYMPVEVGLAKDEQEKVLGRLLNQVIDRLSPEKRKGYLLQPQAVLTPQGMVERVLEADGVTREEIEQQRAKLKLLEELLRTPEDDLETFVAQRDTDFDQAFFQLATVAIQSRGEESAQHAALQRLDKVLALSSYGRDIKDQEEELRAAVESLNSEGEGLTREKLLEIVIQAPGEKRVAALVNVARPAFDYSFFSLLSEEIEKTSGEEKERLLDLRARVLALTEEMDRAQEARAAQSAAVLQTLLNADDLDKALESALPFIDDMFLSILQANIQAAEEKEDEAALGRLQRIDQRLQDLIRQSLPPSLQLAQEVLDSESEEEARALLEESAETIDDQLIRTLMLASERLEQAGKENDARRARQLHRVALRLSMRRKMKSGD